jgi:hypothetical protein
MDGEMEEKGLGDAYKAAGEVVNAMLGGIDQDKMVAEYMRANATREAKHKAEDRARYAEERARYEKLRQKWGANLTNEQLDEAERKEAEGKAADYEIGDAGPSGGLVFSDWDACNGKWGYLECAPQSAEFKTEWSNAISWCRTLNINGFSGWRLPTREELGLMYTNLAKKGLGNFSNNCYFSSEEEQDGGIGRSVWCVDVYNGKSYSRPVENYLDGYVELYFCRPVRSFSGVMTKRKEAIHNAELERLETERRKAERDGYLSRLNTAKAKIHTMRTSSDYDGLAKEFAVIAHDLQSFPILLGLQTQIEECENYRKQCEEKCARFEKKEAAQRKIIKVVLVLCVCAAIAAIVYFYI